MCSWSLSMWGPLLKPTGLTVSSSHNWIQLWKCILNIKPYVCLQFQKRRYAKLEPFRCGKKGCGLKSLEDISQGHFLIEYVGEVFLLLFSRKFFENRIEGYYNLTMQKMHLYLSLVRVIQVHPQSKKYIQYKKRWSIKRNSIIDDSE